MKKLVLLLALFGVLGASCSKDDDNVNNSQKPNDKPKGTFVSDVEGVYNVDMSGGEVVVTVTTDIEYKVVIPTDAKSWISIAETRADLRIDKIKFIIAPNETFEELKADVNLVANNGYVLQKISFVQQGNTKVFNSDCEENYSIGAVGGKINIKVTTNLDYDVVIPNNDKSWISVSDTRAAVREETLTLIVAENKITEERSSVVTLYDKDDNILQKINITQSAKSNTIANNEIWYTTTDGKKLFPPTTEPAIFGAFLVSNTYSDGKGVLTFDDEITLIGGGAFSGCTTLATITIPESVTEIGAYAFDGCGSLTSVNNILDSVTTIGNCTFRDCSSLTSVTIPDSVTTIGDSAFSGCSSLTSTTIPDSVTSIGYFVFSGCTGELVVNCNIPDGYYNHNYYSVFYGSKFTTVTIGDSVTTIGDYAFRDCSSLTSVTIPESVTEIGAYAFDGCGSLTSVTIPDSVTTIGDYAFYGCSSLSSVTIPDSVTTIGFYAFKGCTGELVVNCNIPSASYSDSGAFYGSKFTSVTIESSVTEIGDYAFSNCSSLTSVTIGDSVTTIGNKAFYGCSSLPIIDNIRYADTYLIGATDKTMSVYTIKDNTRFIGDEAFYYCRSLTSVTIPDSVTTIGDYAFSECRSLTGVTIPDSVTTIGNSAFSDCGSLTSITIPDSVTSIGEGAFWGCSSLMELNGKFATGDGRCLIVDGVLNSFAPSGLTEYTIPNSVTSIGYAAFAHCYRLTSVTIPDSVTTIGYAAFYNCSSLTSITIPDSVTTIGGAAFYNCYSLASVTIGDSVTTIGEESFFGCSSLTSVTIPDGVTSIGSLAFFGCSSLARIYCKAIIPPYLGSVYLFCYYSDSYELYYPYRIYVPMESVQAYESAEGWSYYISSIVGYDF